MLQKISFVDFNIRSKNNVRTIMLGLSLSLFLAGCITQPTELADIYKPSLITDSEQAISVIYQSNDLQDAVDKANTLDRETTLVVFDIDDTLLTATEFFGSDKWYEWQRGRALDPMGALVSTSNNEKVNCLFDVLGITFEIAVNKPTQANMAAIVNAVNNDVVILTARSSAYRAATMRELARNQLNFKTQSLAPTDVGYHYDYTLSGRTANVSYVDGVFMVQGMDKGVMLLDLLKRSEHSYASVVFVDDKQNNIDNMANALKNANINFYGFHYNRISKTVSGTELAEANATHDALNKLLTEHFADRAEHLSNQKCDY